MGAVLSCFSNIMYLSEKLSLWMTCVGLICCLVITFVVTLGMGIGLGYNYCFVDLKTRYKYVPGHYVYPGSPRWPHRSGDPGALPGQPAQDDTADLSPDDILRLPTTLPEAVIIQESVQTDFPTEMLTGQPYKPSFDDTDDFRETLPFSRPEQHSTESLSDSLMDSSTEFNATIDEVPTTFTTDVETENVEGEASGSVDDSEINYDPNDDRIDTRPPHPTLGDEPSNKRVKKLVIPISGGDLVSLLSKLRAANKNYSLQIVTT